MDWHGYPIGQRLDGVVFTYLAVAILSGLVFAVRRAIGRTRARVRSRDRLAARLVRPVRSD